LLRNPRPRRDPAVWITLRQEGVPQPVDHPLGAFLHLGAKQWPSLTLRELLSRRMERRALPLALLLALPLLLLLTLHGCLRHLLLPAARPLLLVAPDTIL